MRVLALSLASVMALHAGPVLLIAQTPEAAVPVAPLRAGIRVDTSSAPRREIFTLWRAYLSEGPDRFEPSSHWSRAEQRRWPIFDLTAPWVYFSAPTSPRPEPIVLGIDPASPAQDT